MSDRLLHVALIVGVLVGAALIGKAVYDYERFRTLNDEGRIASATVRDLKPAHNRRGREGRWLVVYAPGDPSMTALTPEQAWAVVLYDERLLVPYMAMLMVLAWNVLERYRRKRT